MSKEFSVLKELLENRNFEELRTRYNSSYLAKQYASRSLIEHFAKENDVSIVMFLLKNGADINQAVKAASSAKHIDLTIRLCKKNASYMMAIWGAAISQDVEYLNYLLSVLHMKIHEAVWHAVSTESASMLMDLQNAGANIDDAIYEAALAGDEELIDKLLDNGAEIKRSIIAAAQEGNTELLRKIMVKDGARIEYAIYGAALSGNKRYLLNLLEENRSKLDEDNNLIFHAVYALYKKKNLLVINEIFNKYKDSPRQAIVAAILHEKFDCADKLLTHPKANIYEVIVWAAQNNHHEIAQYLLMKNRGNIHYAISKAAQNGNCDAVQYLLRQDGANLTCAIWGAALGNREFLLEDFAREGGLNSILDAIDTAAMGYNYEALMALLKQTEKPYLRSILFKQDESQNISFLSICILRAVRQNNSELVLKLLEYDRSQVKESIKYAVKFEKMDCLEAVLDKYKELVDFSDTELSLYLNASIPQAIHNTNNALVLKLLEYDTSQVNESIKNAVLFKKMDCLNVILEKYEALVDPSTKEDVLNFLHECAGWTLIDKYKMLGWDTQRIIDACGTTIKPYINQMILLTIGLRQTTLAKYMLEYIDCYETVNTDAVVRRAIETGHKDFIKYLLCKYDFDLNRAIVAAALGKHRRIIDLLLEAGGDINKSMSIATQENYGDALAMLWKIAKSMDVKENQVRVNKPSSTVPYFVNSFFIPSIDFGEPDNDSSELEDSNFLCRPD